MSTEIVVNLALIFGLPWLIRRGSAYFSSRRKPPHGSGVPSRFSDGAITAYKQADAAKAAQTLKASVWRKWYPTLIQCALVVLAAWHAYALVAAAPPNFLRDIGIAEYDAPSYQVRNAFRRYAEQRRLTPHDDYDTQSADSGHVLFARQAAVYAASGAMPVGGMPDPAAEQWSEHDWHTVLYEALKVGGNRQVYLMFGEDAFRQCDWCRQEHDFFTYAAAPILLQYVGMLFVVGVVCVLVPDKLAARFHLAYALAALMLMSVSLMAIPTAYLPELVGVKYLPVHMYVGHYVVRAAWCMSMLVLLVAHLLRPKQPAVTDAERLFYISRFLAKQVEDKLRFLQLHHAAIMQDEELTRHWVRHEQTAGRDAESAGITAVAAQPTTDDGLHKRR